MRQVLTDAALHADLRARGLARAREFSWERSVRRVREIYAEVLEQ
jgi:glycosyltransferase involved in cell wall biosynthesis